MRDVASSSPSLDRRARLRELAMPAVTQLDPDVELFPDVLAQVIVRIKTSEAAGCRPVDEPSVGPPMARRNVRSPQNEAPVVHQTLGP